jgi:uncharacterized membrane protein
MEKTIVIPPRVRFVMTMAWVFKHWLAIWLLIFSVFNLLPLLAPVFMQLGFEPLGNAIHDLYHLISHQFANRSYFFFGRELMYRPDELPLNLVGDFQTDGSLMAAFRGNAELGWKMAWSDRLTAWFGACLVTAYFYAILRHRKGFRRLSTGWMLILVAPLWIDGISHYISDFTSLTDGFRYTNFWLAFITGNIFPPFFYIGDDLGSFNSLARIVTGILCGIGFMAWGLGRAELYFKANHAILQGRLDDWWARQKLGRQ